MRSVPQIANIKKKLLVFPIIIYFVVAIQYLKRKLTTGWPQLGVQTPNRIVSKPLYLDFNSELDV